MKKALLLGTGVAVVLAMYSLAPDIYRYMKIKSM